MKILVIQLARFGDLFQSYPVCRSLKRNHPDAEIDLFCRETFSEAADLYTSIVNDVHHFSVADLIDEVDDESISSRSFPKLEALLSKLKDSNYDLIINLTFSPLSSYFVEAISNERTEVQGFTRHSDGYLNIPDDPSAMFYAQVGVSRFNRVHVTRLMSAVSGVDLKEEDWRVPTDYPSPCISLPGSYRYVACHIGGSQTNKLLTSEQWNNFFTKMLDQDASLRFVLLGSNSELELAEKIEQKSPKAVLNFVGKTSFRDLFRLIEQSEILVGPDSSLIHIASLLNKKTLNYSFATNNFWETGPLAEKSLVVWSRSPKELALDGLVKNGLYLLGVLDEPTEPYAKVTEDQKVESYELIGYDSKSFEWELTKAIYLGDEFPILDDIEVFTAFKQMAELADMVLRDIELVKQKSFKNLSLEIVRNVDQLLHTLEKLVPSVRPIIWWFNTERLRIGPYTDLEILESNYKAFTNLRSILSVYVGASFVGDQLVDTNL